VQQRLTCPLQDDDVLHEIILGTSGFVPWSTSARTTHGPRRCRVQRIVWYSAFIPSERPSPSYTGFRGEVWYFTILASVRPSPSVSGSAIVWYRSISSPSLRPSPWNPLERSVWYFSTSSVGEPVSSVSNFNGSCGTSSFVAAGESVARYHTSTDRCVFQHCRVIGERRRRLHEGIRPVLCTSSPSEDVAVGVRVIGSVRSGVPRRLLGVVSSSSLSLLREPGKPMRAEKTASGEEFSRRSTRRQGWRH